MWKERIRVLKVDGMKIGCIPETDSRGRIGSWTYTPLGTTLCLFTIITAVNGGCKNKNNAYKKIDW
tara:strand:+ start:866 stop:1063 length:198 start_codon:yes stop_codon:yes gene_type:complete